MLGPAVPSCASDACTVAPSILFCVSGWGSQAFVTFKDAFKRGQLDDDAQETNLQAIRTAMRALNALDSNSTIYPIQQYADSTVSVATEAR